MLACNLAFQLQELINHEAGHGQQACFACELSMSTQSGIAVGLLDSTVVESMLTIFTGF
jgi:hypothetical protein